MQRHFPARGFGAILHCTSCSRSLTSRIFAKIPAATAARHVVGVIGLQPSPTPQTESGASSHLHETRLQAISCRGCRAAGPWVELRPWACRLRGLSVTPSPPNFASEAEWEDRIRSGTLSSSMQVLERSRTCWQGWSFWGSVLLIAAALCHPFESLELWSYELVMPESTIQDLPCPAGVQLSKCRRLWRRSTMKAMAATTASTAGGLCAGAEIHSSATFQLP